MSRIKVNVFSEQIFVDQPSDLALEIEHPGFLSVRGPTVKLLLPQTPLQLVSGNHIRCSVT